MADNAASPTLSLALWLRAMLAVAVIVLAAGLIGPATQSADSKAPAAGGFGDNGRITTNFATMPIEAYASQTALDSRGRLLMSSWSSTFPDSFSVWRFLPDGSLDPDFADGGRLKPGFGGTVSLTPDDSVFISGSLGGGSSGGDMAVRKYRPNGGVDRSFGNRGTVRTDLGLDDSAQQVFVQPSGRIVAFGTGNCSGPDCGYSFAIIGIARYTARGKLIKLTRSSSFEGAGDVRMYNHGEFVVSSPSTDGESRYLLRVNRNIQITSSTTFVITNDEGVWPESIDTQSDGRIVATGGFKVTRFEADDKTPDPGFDGTTPVCPDTLYYSVGGNLTVLHDDRILVYGTCGVTRLTADGEIDATFGTGGLLTVPSATESLVLGLGSGDGFAVGSSDEQTGRLVARRFDPDGSPDLDFSDGGESAVRLKGPTPERANAVTADSKGRIIAAGHLNCLGQGCGGFAVARYRRGGRLDRSFGGDGRVVTSGWNTASVHAVATYSDGSIVAAGTGYTAKHIFNMVLPGTQSFSLAKYLPSGELDHSFGNDGVVLTPAGAQPGKRSTIYGVALQKDRKIVAVGFSECSRRTLCMTVARYLPDGELDSSFADQGILRLEPPTKNGSVAKAVAIQRDGRIVVTGGNTRNFITVRLKRNGSLDRSFSGGGVVLARHPIKFKSGSRTDLGQLANAVVIGGNRRITIGGGGSFGKGLVFRYLPNGRLDRSFGRRGKVRIPALEVTDLALADCSLFATGNRKGSGGNVMGLVSMPWNGVRKGLTNRIRTPFGTRHKSIGAGLVPTGGRRSLVLAGSFIRRYRVEDFALAKFKTGKLVRGCRR